MFVKNFRRALLIITVVFGISLIYVTMDYVQSPIIYPAYNPSQSQKKGPGSSRGTGKAQDKKSDPVSDSDPSHQLPPEFRKSISKNRTNYLLSNACENFPMEKNVDILIFITTARKNEKIRNWFRQIYSELSGFDHKFVIGQTPPGESLEVTKMVNREIEHYSDLVIGNFPDTYQNLIYKTHATYQYAEGIYRIPIITTCITYFSWFFECLSD